MVLVRVGSLIAGQIWCKFTRLGSKTLWNLRTEWIRGTRNEEAEKEEGKVRGKGRAHYIYPQPKKCESTPPVADAS